MVRAYGHLVSRFSVSGRCGRGGRGGLAGRSCGCRPDVAGVGDEVVHLVGGEGVDAELLDGEVDGARLGVEGVEVDDDENDVGQVVRSFAVGEQVVVASLVEAEAVVRWRAGLSCRSC